MCGRFIYLTCSALVLGLVGDASGQAGKGNILFEYFWGTGAGIDTLLGLPSFPDDPDDSEWRDAFEGNTNWRDNYGTRARGYIYPLQTGDYTFWIASDDNSQLWLSRDSDPADATVIAAVPGQTNSWQWDKYPEQRSDPITLQAGQRYYIEALQSQGGSRGHLSVAWQEPGIGAGPVVIEGAFLSPWLRQSDLIATNPDPPNGAENVRAPLMLQWTPGMTGFFHYVYVGTNATLDPAELAIERHNTHYLYSLAPATTYYWRVDEVEIDGTTKHTGEVWSFSTPPLTAHNPDPADSARFVDPDADLRWGAGATAIAHDVYLGTDESAVANATKTSPEFKVYQLAKTYDPGTLDMGTVYYWRIDEVEADGTTKYTGDVWRFVTIPEITTISDPDLIGWWKLDEGPGGTVAVDWSGHGNDGILRNGPQWVTDGYDGGALHFDGSDDYVAIKNLIYSGGGHTEVSVCAWIRTDSEDDQYIIDFDNSEYWLLVINYTAGPGEIGWIVSSDTGEVRCSSSTRVDDGQWHHVAGMFDNGTSTIYIDGIARSSASGGSTFGDELGNIRYGFMGANSEATAYDGIRGQGSPIMGDLDDVRVYDKALTQAEIEEVMRGDLLLAWNPNPANGSTADLDKATSLSCSWSPAEAATKHDIYLGTDEFAVAVADISDTTGIYRGWQDTNSYIPPDEGVEFGQSYYWRVDETNTDGTISVGRVWSFTVADYLVLEDFESYDDYGNRIYYTWLDGWGYTQPPPGDPGNGTGSTVGYLEEPYAEQNIVHRGRQSMPFEYLNDGSTGKALYSETTRTSELPQDWTRHDIKALTLWFKGASASASSFNYDPVTGISTMTADGADITGASDHFHYVYKQLTGVGSITAKVLSVTDTHDWAKAGVMIRETLDPDSPHAMAVITPTKGFWFGWREEKGELSESQMKSGIKTPQWLRLERLAGNTFKAYYSADGSNWVEVGDPQEILMPAGVYIGLALTSRNVNKTCIAEFTDVTMGGSTVGEWQSQDIGIESNVAEQLYVAVEDSTGKSEVVNHPDPNAVLLDSWQEWNIDLVEFTGVNMQSVKKMSIGVGNRADPQEGGSGDLYIDDIRLYQRRFVPDKLPPMIGDLVYDGMIDYADLGALAVEWLDSGADLTADLDSDGDVDLKDYAVLVSGWLSEQLWPAE